MLTTMEKCDNLAFAGTVLLGLFGGYYEPIYIWCRPGHKDELRRLRARGVSSTIVHFARTPRWRQSALPASPGGAEGPTRGN